MSSSQCPKLLKEGRGAGFSNHGIKACFFFFFFFSRLADFISMRRTARKPTWGTCAGLILLAEEANATKKGGQELIGGLDVRVHRNHFGRQIESFVADVELPFLAQSDLLAEADAAAPFPGVFIRAPIVEQLLMQDSSIDSVAPGVLVASENPAKARVEILSVLPDRTKRVKGGPVASSTEVHGGDLNNIVAVRQGNIMGTSFHPELTDDIRIHVWWLEQVMKSLPQHT